MKTGPIVLVIGLLGIAGIVGVLASGFRFDPHAVNSPLIGKPAPDFALAALEPDDGTVQLSALSGRPVVLNFWATWCVPCQQEHPALLALAREFRGLVQFYGVVYQDKPETIRVWLDARGRGYPTLLDNGAQTAIAYGVYGVPETFVVDKRGVIREKVAGAVDFAAMMNLLTSLVAE